MCMSAFQRLVPVGIMQPMQGCTLASFPAKTNLTHLRVVAVRLKGKHGDEEEEKQLQRGSYPVVQEGCNAAEDATRNDDRIHYCAQARLCEHDVRSRARLHPTMAVQHGTAQMTVCMFRTLCCYHANSLRHVTRKV